MKLIENVSRRGFLQASIASGVFVLSARIVPAPLWADDQPAPAPLEPSLWMSISVDGTVTIVAHRSEMGCGSRTALPMILADELGADWTRVKIDQAIGDPRYGDQETDGSHSVRDNFDLMRQTGAAARLMLIRAAAAQWNVPAGECDTSQPHFVFHRGTGKKAGFGELAEAASKQPVPKLEELKLNPRSAWRYIGKENVPLYDLQDIVLGKAIYGIDAKLDGMVYASIEHPPVVGGSVKSCDDKETLKVPGVKQTVALDAPKPPYQFQPLGGVAVIANNTWAAFQGRAKLKIDWENGPNAGYDSGEFRKILSQTARQPGNVFRNVGDVDAAFGNGGKIVEAEYYVPHLAHVSMEPPNAVADVRDGKVFCWAPTQNPQAVQDHLSSLLGIKKEDVVCHVTLLGGGFGRKSFPDFVGEAAVLSKRLGKPVKVTWNREDDIRCDFYHTVANMYLKASLNGQGRPTAWLQRSVFPPINSTFEAGARDGTSDDMDQGWADLPFDIPNLRVENGPADAHLRIGWFRSVANVYHAFALHSFADELAHAAGKDPVEYLLQLIGPARKIDFTGSKYTNYGTPLEQFPYDTARLRRVIEVVAEKSGWGKRAAGKGHALGIAAHRAFLTYVATVVEVEVDNKGRVHIPNVWTALDAGTVVSPDNVRHQFEGAAVFGASLALFGEITASKGAINQSNFNDYPITRINQTPGKISVHIVENDAPPAGVGEPGVPPFAPALCNAIFAATGKRVRELPLSKTKLV